VGGSIAGPGGPYDRHGVVVDTSDAVLLDGSQVALIEARRSAPGAPPSELAFALELQGRVNRTQDRANVLYVLNADGLAALVTELLAVATRAGATDLLTEVLERVQKRWEEVPR
jgi:hypothetical protein